MTSDDTPESDEDQPSAGTRPASIALLQSAKEALGIVREHLAPDGAVYIFWTLATRSPAELATWRTG